MKATHVVQFDLRRRPPRRIRPIHVTAIAALLLASSPAALAQNPPRVVTLITGDRVVVSGRSSEGLRIERASGRERVRFITRRVPSRSGQSPHWHVIPEDAVPLIAADKLDPRLFDVTLLIDFEYDDARRDNLPLIATFPQRSSARVATGARNVPGAVTEWDLMSIDAMSVTAPKGSVQEVWGAVAGAAPAGGAARAATTSEPMGKLWLDGLRRPALDRSVQQIGAPAAWALGYEGDGVVVAVLDTGVDDAHPDLEGSVVESRNFTLDPDGDLVGHGTHVASIIAGSGAAQGGLYRGVAPRVELLAGKVCDLVGCPESSIIAGMQWAVEEGARIVNMSLGGLDTPDIDPLEEAVNTLSAAYETLFVVSAGNTGPDAATVESPGSAEAALTVGAVDRDDQVALFSSRGMTLGTEMIKPDLTAPGVDIVAARAAGTLLGFPVGEVYVAASGTSFATPHATGAAALLLQQHPEWSGVELKAALLGSAVYNPALAVADQGAGRLEVAAALETSLLADPPSISLGVARWPHEDDAVITRAVSVRNLGAATTLELEVDVLAPDGSPPPSGMFRVTPARLSLAAGATGSVMLAVDTRLAAPDGLYGGRLLASDGAERALAVPLAVTRERESYDLVVRNIDRDGMETSDVIGFVHGYDEPIFAFFLPTPEAPQTTLRLPRGRYALEVDHYDVEGIEPSSILIAPNQRLDSNRRINFDAQSAVPMRVKAPDTAGELQSVSLAWSVPSSAVGLSSGSTFGPPANGAPSYYAAHFGPREPNLVAVLDARWLAPGANPSALAAAWTARGRLPAGPVKSVDPRRLAVVSASYAAPLTSLDFDVTAVGVGSHIEGSLSHFLHGWGLAELPHRHTEYYYSDDETTRWVNELYMQDADFLHLFTMGGVPTTYRAGRRYAVGYNEPPFSPVLPQATLWDFEWIYRRGDTLIVSPIMYGDRHGHAGFLSSEIQSAVYRNGRRIPDSDVIGMFELPPEGARYRVEVDMTQSMFELTTQAKSAWTFESAHVPEGEPHRLPLLTVRFDPELDERGRAPRGRHFRIPMRVARFDQEGAIDVKEPRVEASFDDGATWARAKVERQGKHWALLLEHPQLAEHVSLRAAVQDREGNGVEQTLIRAYALDARR